MQTQTADLPPKVPPPPPGPSQRIITEDRVLRDDRGFVLFDRQIVHAPVDFDPATLPRYWFMMGPFQVDTHPNGQPIIANPPPEPVPMDLPRDATALQAFDALEAQAQRHQDAMTAIYRQQQKGKGGGIILPGAGDTQAVMKNRHQRRAEAARKGGG